MIRRVVTSLGLSVAMTLAAHIDAARAVELAIPYGYFNTSGGFYSQGIGQCACLRFAAAGGCAGAINYPAAAHPVFPDARTESATYSWYAGRVPTYGTRAACPGQFQPPAADQPVVGREDVGPGLPTGPP